MFFKSNINQWIIYLYLYTAIYFILLSSIRIWLLVYFFLSILYNNTQRADQILKHLIRCCHCFLFIYVNSMFVFACFICVYLTVNTVQSIFTSCSYLLFIYHFWFLKLFNDYHHLWILLMYLHDICSLWFAADNLRNILVFIIKNQYFLIKYRAYKLSDYHQTDRYN